MNVAARIEGLTAPGSIGVSAIVYDQVKNKTNTAFADTGEHVVKNIVDPVRVYRVRDSRVVPGDSGNRRRVLLPDEPSIVVLPFVNISGDAADDYFSDGMTQDIITTLAKLSGIFVIARHSAFAFKARSAKVQHIVDELGVRYVLEGSVRRAAERVRVTAQLVDGLTGRHMWANRYDGDMTDVLALQEAIAERVVTELQVQLTTGEQARLWRRATVHPDAYDAFLRGRERFFVMRRAENGLARELFQRALGLDASFVHAMVLLGGTYLNDAWYDWAGDGGQSLSRALAVAETALQLDDSNAEAHALIGMSKVLQQHHSEAVFHSEKAVTLSPSGADVAAFCGDVLNLSDRAQDGLVMIRRAMQLSPIYPTYYLTVLAHAYLLMDQFPAAVETYQRFAAREPANPRPFIGLATSFVLGGAIDEARKAADAVVRLYPKFSVERWARHTPYRSSEVLGRAVAALKQAGLK